MAFGIDVIPILVVTSLTLSQRRSEGVNLALQLGHPAVCLFLSLPGGRSYNAGASGLCASFARLGRGGIDDTFHLEAPTRVAGAGTLRIGSFRRGPVQQLGNELTSRLTVRLTPESDLRRHRPD